MLGSSPPDTASEPFDETASQRRRRANRNRKWTTYEDDVLPAWIAEHDFTPPRGITNALTSTVDRRDFGYHNLDADVGIAFTEWARQRYGWAPEPSMVHTCVDVLQGVTAAVTALAAPGDGVVLTPPIYQIFLQICPTSRRRQLEWPMRYDSGIGWTLDPDDLEALLQREPQARVLLWCHPHNPTGRVTDPEVLARIVELAHKYDIYIVSDEIHADLSYGDSSARFMSMLEVPGASSRVVTVTSPAKTFALSGLRCAVMAYNDRDLRRRVRSAHPLLLLGHASRSGIDATIAAWTTGAAWADGLLKHLTANRQHLARRLAAEAPEVVFHQPEATFLAWLDVSACELGDRPAESLLNRARVALNEGTDYGSNGAGHVRLNFGTSRAMLDRIIDRLIPHLGS